MLLNILQDTWHSPNKEFIVVAKMYTTLCDPMDCGPLGSSVHGISQQEYWNGLPFTSPGDLPNPGIKSMSPAWQADSLPLSHLGSLQPRIVLPQ